MDKESKNIAVASYITPIGWCVAIVAKELCGVKNSFVVFHLRQSFGLNAIFAAFWILFNFVNIWIVEQLFMVVVTICIVYGAIGAYEGKERFQFLFGQLFDKKFTFLK